MTQTANVTGVKTCIQQDAGAVRVQYHDTVVARRAPDGLVTLDTGGWRTVTTRLRMNQFANEFCGGRFHVHQHKGAWEVSTHAGELIPFPGNTLTFRP